MEHKEQVAAARVTGLWYLLLAVAGVLGFMVYHPQVFVSGDPQKTLANLTEHESVAGIRLVLEVVIIGSQALAAVWFYKLLRETKAWAAFAIAGWGLMNSAAIMVSAIAMGAAIQVAHAAVPGVEEKVILIQLLSAIISNAWMVGGLFFGLWLIPMGYVVITSRRMPLWLGRTLIVGGIGYLVSTFLNCMNLAPSLVEVLPLPATIGEFWMIGYLLTYGIRPGVSEVK